MFFLSLQRLRVEKRGGKLSEILKAEGVRGIALYPYNYKEVLSRRIIAPGDEAPSSNREDALWRMLLTENVSSGDESADLPDDLPIPPEMIPAILRKVNAAAGKRDHHEAGPESVPDAISPKMLQRVLVHLGETLHRLPVEQKSAILQSLDPGVADAFDDADGDGGLADADIVRTLTGAETDDEFLELLATLLVAEKKSGNRIRKIFEVIATERNREGSLLPAVKGRVRESVRTKNYYAQKAWEAIERLLLKRTEAAYIGQDHYPSAGEAVDPRTVDGRNGRRKPAGRPGGHVGIRGGESPPQGSRRPAGAARGRGGRGGFPGSARGDPEDHPEPDFPGGAPPPEDHAIHPDVGSPERPGKQEDRDRTRGRRAGFRPHDRPLPLARRFEAGKGADRGDPRLLRRGIDRGLPRPAADGNGYGKPEGTPFPRLPVRRGSRSRESGESSTTTTGISCGTCASSSGGSAILPWFPTSSGCSTTRTSG